MLNWIKSWFHSDNEEPHRNNTQTEPPVIQEIKRPQIPCPKDWLDNLSLNFQQLQLIQDIIEKETNPSCVYQKLMEISEKKENIRLYLHELMFFSSIRFERTPFYVNVAKLIIDNYPNLRDFLVSQIFWCFDRYADIFVYTAIELGLFTEQDLCPFQKAAIRDLSDFLNSDSDHKVYDKYIRFSEFFDGTLAKFDIEENLKKISINNKPNMRSCVNPNITASKIRSDNPTNISYPQNIPKCDFDRNDLVANGCDVVEYSAFYGARKCFMKLFPHYNNEKTKMSIADLSACGGDLEICKEIKQRFGEKAFENSIQYSIRYHRDDVFDWLVHSLKISMTEIDYKTAVEYEYVPAIEMYLKMNRSVIFSVNFEAGKSGNYILFMNLWEIKNYDEKNLEEKGAIILLFLYNSVDCIKYILTRKINLNKCTWYDGKKKYLYDRHYYQNPFHIAILRQYLGTIKKLLKYSDIDINQNYDSSTFGGWGTLCISKYYSSPPLNLAISTDNTDLIQLLLSIDELKVNEPTFYSGGSSSSMSGGSSNNGMAILRVAAKHGNLNVLKVLLESPRIDKSLHMRFIADGTGYNSCHRDIVSEGIKSLEYEYPHVKEQVIELLKQFNVQ